MTWASGTASHCGKSHRSNRNICARSRTELAVALGDRAARLQLQSPHPDYDSERLARELRVIEERAFVAQAVDFIRARLSQYSLPGHRVGFEMTETAAIGNLSRAAELMCQLRALGCPMSLDDFGSGMENAETLLALEQIGVDFAQGYHLARPMPMTQAVALLAADPPMASSSESISAAASPR